MVCKVKLVLSPHSRLADQERVYKKLQNSTQNKPNIILFVHDRCCRYHYSIHLVYNCKHVQQHHLGISAVLLTHPSSPKTSLRRLHHTNCFFVSLSPQLSRLFFVFFPVLLTQLPRPRPRRTEGQLDKVHSAKQIFKFQTVKVKVQPSCRLNALYIQFLCNLYCVPVYCHLFYVYFLSLYLSLSFLVYSKKRS